MPAGTPLGSLGSTRKELSPTHIEDITRIFGAFEEVTREGVPLSRITLTVERPERDAQDRPVLGTKGKGKPVTDANLRDTEVLPHAPDAWIDAERTKVGYEIPFNRHFYVFKPPRKLEDIDKDLKGVTDRILSMIGGLSQ